jgi:subtilisin family serine protease
VISMSLGIDFPGFVAALQAKGMPAEMATSMALEGYRTNILLFEQLAGLVKAQGALVQACVIAAAAGNESRRDQNPDFEIGVSPPAVAAGIVSVAALAEGAGGLTVAPFSNTGARVAGPGVNIVSAKAGNPNGTVAMSGTSMATPHVAGVAALWAEKLKKTNQLTPQMLSDKLVGSATQDTLKPGFDPADTGGGIVQAPKQ